MSNSKAKKVSDKFDGSMTVKQKKATATSHQSQILSLHFEIHQYETGLSELNIRNFRILKDVEESLQKMPKLKPEIL